MTQTLTVFISYSHDSDAHRAFTLSLANRLREDGLDCRIDQYVNGFPAEGWQRWMENQIEQADYVLIVCTSRYLQRYRGQDPDGGRGVNFEGVVISQTLYDHYYRNTKFIPVIPEQGSLDDVPLPLKGYTTYTLPQDYTELYRLLTDQHATPAPEIGKIVYLAPEKSGGLALQVNVVQQKVQIASYTNLPDAAVNLMIGQLQEQLCEQKLNNYNLNDLLEKYRREVSEWEQKYKDALVQNAADLKKNPDNLLLEEEQRALQIGELEKAAQIREAYYQDLKQAKTAELAMEAYVVAERWEGAFKLARALELYQEAVMFRRNYPEAWRSINRIAKRLGDYDVALEAAQNLQKQLDPEKDAWWFAVALIDEADILSAFGHNQKANDQYQKSHGLLVRLAKTEPNNHQLARDLSVSYDRVGDMHLKTGDNVAALKAYQDGLAIAKKLAELDPNHTEWQRDLSVSHNKVGDMHLKTGDNVAALKAYQDGLAIAKKLAELDPNVVEWQTDLVVSYFKLAQIQEDAQKQLLQDALDILSRLHREKRLDHEKQRWIGILQESLQQIAAE